MVKFSKELEAQLIPEWKDAFVNYWQLKKQIKKIKLSQKPAHPHRVLDHEYGLSIFDPIRSLANNISSKLFHSDTMTEIIQVLVNLTYTYMHVYEHTRISRAHWCMYYSCLNV
jgi:SPX domain protein involved in polyphosphate accumulation